MDLLTDVRLLVALLLTYPLGCFLMWTRLSERQWLLSARRKRAARSLFRKSAWKKAAALDDHFAMVDAFGRSVESSELAFIETRQDPARLLLERPGAGAWVKFEVETERYVDGRPQHRVSLAFLRLAPAMRQG